MLSEFRQAHGRSISWPDPHRPADLQRRWLFEDGAIQVQSAGRAAEFIDPPAEDEARLKLQKEYHESRCYELAQAFASLKAVAIGNVEQYGGSPAFEWDEAAFGPQPPDTYEGVPDAVAGLTRLKQLFNEHTEKVIELDEQIEALPHVKQRRLEADIARHQRDAAEAAQAAAEAAQIGRIQSITLGDDDADERIAKLLDHAKQQKKVKQQVAENIRDLRGVVPTRGF